MTTLRRPTATRLWPVLFAALVLLSVAVPTPASPVREPGPRPSSTCFLLSSSSKYKSLHSLDYQESPSRVPETRVRGSAEIRRHASGPGQQLKEELIRVCACVYDGLASVGLVVSNNPINFRDPAGLSPELLTLDGLPPVRPLSDESLDRLEDSYRLAQREGQERADIGFAAGTLVSVIPGAPQVLAALSLANVTKASATYLGDPTIQAGEDQRKAAYAAILALIAARQASGGCDPGLRNPFKGKAPSEIDAMFRAKGWLPRGPDPIAGKGGYVNPANGRSYHIDPANSFGEPPHVDVNRLPTYRGPVPKKKYFLGE